MFRCILAFLVALIASGAAQAQIRFRGTSDHIALPEKELKPVKAPNTIGYRTVAGWRFGEGKMIPIFDPAIMPTDAVRAAPPHWAPASHHRAHVAPYAYPVPKDGLAYGWYYSKATGMYYLYGRGPKGEILYWYWVTEK